MSRVGVVTTPNRTTTLNILFSVVVKESEMSVEQGRGGNHTK